MTPLFGLLKLRGTYGRTRVMQSASLYDEACLLVQGVCDTSPSIGHHTCHARSRPCHSIIPPLRGMQWRSNLIILEIVTHLSGALAMTSEALASCCTTPKGCTTCSGLPENFCRRAPCVLPRKLRGDKPLPYESRVTNGLLTG